MYTIFTIQIWRVSLIFSVLFSKSEYWQAKHFSMEPRFEIEVCDKEKVINDKFKIAFECD